MKILLTILLLIPALVFSQQKRQEKVMGNATTTWAQKKPAGSIGLVKIRTFLFMNDGTGATDTTFIAVQWNGTNIDTGSVYRWPVLPGEPFQRTGEFDAVWIRSEAGNNPYRLLMIP